jgi:hypothetical protein
MLCKRVDNTKGTYLFAMIGGGGWMKNCMIVGEVTEDVEEAWLGGID